MPSPPPIIPITPPVLWISSLTDSENAIMLLSSQRRTSPTSKTFCTIVPVPEMKAVPVPVSFCRTRPIPPQQQVLKLQSRLTSTSTSPYDAINAPCCAIIVPLTSGELMSIGTTLAVGNIGVKATNASLVVLVLLKFATQQSSPAQIRLQQPSHVATVSMPSVIYIIVEGSDLTVSPGGSFTVRTCDSLPVTTNFESGSTGT
mmetsp:Transcript_21126/g.24317  ORF Transcript_21126/g.24317 Transcript_21126/m.24317 type:complete len:202 (-) Transcript_21126:153-758(-)